MQLIEGVTKRELCLIPDERGFLMEILRQDWPEYQGFGQVYLTSVYPGIVKAWHCHQRQWDQFVCVQGMAKVVLYDEREESSTQGEINEFFMGELNPLLLQIPPRIYHGFTAVGEETALLINIPTQLYNYGHPDEDRLPYNHSSIPYSWEVRHR